MKNNTLRQFHKGIENRQDETGIEPPALKLNSNAHAWYVAALYSDAVALSISARLV